MVIAGLEKKLTPEFLKGADLLLIAGDVFDRALSFYHDDIQYIVSWVTRLIARCKALGIIVVVLEGTPSHDRMQSRIFEAVAKSLHAELYYVTEVDILYLEKYDLRILCVPDEKNADDETTLNQVKAMMAAQAIEKVDFGLMHGFFDFQVPAWLKMRYHESKSYLDLVRYLIFIGHDHTYQKHDRIIVQGSPDRQRQGMEEDKGFVDTVVQRDGTYQSTFVVNEHAMVFKTLEISEDHAIAEKEIEAMCQTLPDHSHLRLAGFKANAHLQSLNVWAKRYPTLVFDEPKFLDPEELEQTTDDIGVDDDYIPFTISPSNIEEVITSRITGISTEEERTYLGELIASVA